jgi:hypothetical protein
MELSSFGDFAVGISEEYNIFIIKQGVGGMKRTRFTSVLKYLVLHIEIMCVSPAKRFQRFLLIDEWKSQCSFCKNNLIAF